MQAENRARYAERIERAIALLERNASAGGTTSIDELASAAALSPYHFHRIFRLMTGETVGAARDCGEEQRQDCRREPGVSRA